MPGNPQLYQKITKLQAKLQSQISKSQSVGKQVAQMKDLMRKFRQKQIQIPKSAYCESVGGFNVKIGAKKLYPHLENRLKTYMEEKKELEKGKQKILKQLFLMLKQKQINSMNLQSLTLQHMRKYIQENEDDINI